MPTRTSNTQLQFEPQLTFSLPPRSFSLRRRNSGGKGTQRKKVVTKARSGAVVEDKKLQAALKKLELSALTGCVCSLGQLSPELNR